MLNKLLLQIGSNIDVANNSGIVDKIAFVLDYILFPIFGIILLVIVYKLIKNNKIIITPKNGKEE